MLMIDGTQTIRVRVTNPGLTYDLRGVGVDGLFEAIAAIDAPGPLFLALTPEQRVAFKEANKEAE